MSVEGDRLLLVNLGRQLEYSALPEPLFAPPLGAPWRKLWSSNEVSFGGDGTPNLESEQGVTIPGECAVLLVPSSRASQPPRASGEPNHGSTSSAAPKGTSFAIRRPLTRTPTHAARMIRARHVSGW